MNTSDRALNLVKEKGMLGEARNWSATQWNDFIKKNCSSGKHSSDWAAACKNALRVS